MFVPRRAASTILRPDHRHETGSAERSQFALLKKKCLGPFFGVQFLGAFDDNVFSPSRSSS
jgi:hypothetical protein